MKLVRLLAVACGVLASLASVNAEAATIRVGDLLVTGGGQLLAINPTTGDQVLVSSGGLIGTGAAVVQAADGYIYVAAGAFLQPGNAVIRIDPFTGTQTVFATDTNPSNRAFGIALRPSTGDFYVMEAGTNDRVVRVNKTTGAVTALPAGGNFLSPYDGAFGPDGMLYVADAGDKVIQVNPDTGAEVVIASGFTEPQGIAIAADGTIYVGDPDANAIRKIVGTTASIFSSGGLMAGKAPTAVAIGSDGTVYVALEASTEVIRITSGGVQSSVSSGGLLSAPNGITFATFTTIPEPGTVGALALGLAAFVASTRRTRRGPAS